MSKYQPLSEHLASRPGDEWPASFSELEAVLGFPLPKAARAGRAWWSNDLDKSHSRAWAAHGWAVGDVDHAAEQVVFRRGAASGAALVEAAGLKPLGESAAVEPLAPPPAGEVSAANAGRSQPPAPIRASASRALGATALVTAGVAVVAGVGAALVRGMMRRRNA
jgi:hypothetical protein